MQLTSDLQPAYQVILNYHGHLGVSDNSNSSLLNVLQIAAHVLVLHQRNVQHVNLHLYSMKKMVLDAIWKDLGRPKKKIYKVD